MIKRRVSRVKAVCVEVVAVATPKVESRRALRGPDAQLVTVVATEVHVEGVHSELLTVDVSALEKLLLCLNCGANRLA